VKKLTHRQLQKIATSFYRGMKSFADLYSGGSYNVFGRRRDSVSTLTILVTSDNLIRGVEMNSTYFVANDRVKYFNSKVSYDNPVSYEAAMAIVESEEYKLIKR